MKKLLLCAVLAGAYEMHAAVGTKLFTVTNKTGFTLTLTATIENNKAPVGSVPGEITDTIQTITVEPNASHVFELMTFSGTDAMGATNTSLKSLTAEANSIPGSGPSFGRIGLMLPGSVTIDQFPTNGVNIVNKGAFLSFENQ